MIFYKTALIFNMVGKLTQNLIKFTIITSGNFNKDLPIHLLTYLFYTDFDNVSDQ